MIKNTAAFDRVKCLSVSQTENEYGQVVVLLDLQRVSGKWIGFIFENITYC